MALANEEEIARLTQNVIEEFRTLGRVTPGTAKALHDAQTEIENFNFKVEVGTKFIGKLGDAVANTAKAMYRGEKGASAFNQSIGDMADAAQIAAVGLSLLIPGGPIMKAVVAGLTYLGTSALKAGTELMQTANAQSDSLYNSFQKMSKVGAAGSDGLTGVFNDIQKLGLGIQDLDGYMNLLNESSQDLAMFRGSVTAGRRAFADMNQEMMPFTEQLYNAGLSQEEIAAGAMGYLKIQTQIGRAQTMTTAELAQGAKKYLIEQDALTKLTGQTRQQAEAARAKAMSEQRFRAVVERGLRSDDADQREGAQKLILANQFLSNQSEAAGQGFRDLTTNMITTDAGLKAYNSSNGAALRISQLLRNNQINVIDGMQDLTAAFGENGDALMSMAETGVYEDYGIPFADTMKLGTLSGNNLVDALKKVEEEQKNQGVTGKKAQDDLQQAQTEIRILQRDTMLLTQAFVQEGVGPATDAMKKLAEAANAAATALLGETKARKILQEPGPAPTIEQQKDIAKTSAGVAGSVIEGAVVGGGGGEGDAGAIMAAAGDPSSQPKPIPKNAGFLRKYFNVGASDDESPASAPPVTLPMTSGGPKGQASGSAPAQPGQPVTSYSERLLNYIKSTEGFEATAKWDKKQWSNGYGTKAKFPTGGQSDTGPKETVDKATAEARMTNYLQSAVSRVIAYGKEKGYKWGQGQIDALTSFSYNAGIGALDQLTDGGKRSNEEIAAKILEYNKAKNNNTGEREVVAGLTRRRQEELAMFKGAREGGVFDGPMSGYPMTLHGPEAVIPLKDGMVPVSINPTGLMNLMPSLDIDSETADQISESFKTGMNVDFSGIVNSLNGLVRQQQDQNNLGLQERMISLLEDIRSSQVNTADNTGRMAAVAAN